MLMTNHLSYSWASRILIFHREEECFFASLGTFDRLSHTANSTMMTVIATGHISNIICITEHRNNHVHTLIQLKGLY